VNCQPDRCAAHFGFGQESSSIGSVLSDGTNQGQVQVFGKGLVKTKESEDGSIGLKAAWYPNTADGQAGEENRSRAFSLAFEQDRQRSRGACGRQQRPVQDDGVAAILSAKSRRGWLAREGSGEKV
jgi:hypothetical protein